MRFVGLLLLSSCGSSAALVYVNTSRRGMLTMATTSVATVWTPSTVYGLPPMTIDPLEALRLAALPPGSDDNDNDEEMLPFDDCDMEDSDDDGYDDDGYDDDDIETDEEPGETADTVHLASRHWLWGLTGCELYGGDLAKGVGS